MTNKCQLTHGGYYCIIFLEYEKRVDNMESKITKEKILIITTILVVSIVFIGIGYAFFTANNPEGSTAQIISKTGRMLITYNDGTDNIVPVTNIQPSNENILIDKTFSLTGTNTTTGNTKMMPFDISIEYQSTFENSELFYFLKRVDANDKVRLDIEGGALTEEILNQFGFPVSLLNSYAGFITDYSGEIYSQLIASGYFKPSDKKESVTLNLKMLFVETGREQDYNKGATFNGKIVVTPGAEIIEDNWDVIATNVKNGNSSKYKVGSKKEVLIDGKEYTLRVANNTSPEECSRADFSKTACGFVFEFADIVEDRPMNSTYTNVGGWPATEMRTYANGEFYNKLPEELRKVIIDTKVVSGHGSSDKNANRTDGNWESTDKIYLLSAHEVWADGTSRQISRYDTAYNQTRQLDYYANLGVTTSSNSGALKKYNGSNYDWWTRGVHSNGTNGFFLTEEAIIWSTGFASDSCGFAPAFRIG